MPGSTPIYANLTEEAHNKQPGISWVFFRWVASL